MAPTNSEISEIQLVLLAIDQDLQRLSPRVDELAELLTTLANCVTTLTTDVATLAGRTDLALADVEALAGWMQVLNQGIAATQKPVRCDPPIGWPLLTVQADNHQGGASDATH